MDIVPPLLPDARWPGQGWRLGATAFASNLVWELSHERLYAKHVPVAIYVRAAAADAVLIAASSVAADRLTSSRRTATATFVGLLAAVAVAIEVQALTSRRWSYTDAMPTVGGIGLRRQADCRRVVAWRRLEFAFASGAFGRSPRNLSTRWHGRRHGVCHA